MIDTLITLAQVTDMASPYVLPSVPTNSTGIGHQLLYNIIIFVMSGGLVTSIGAYFKLKSDNRRSKVEVGQGKAAIDNTESSTRTNEWKEILDKYASLEGKANERNHALIEIIEKNNVEIKNLNDKVKELNELVFKLNAKVYKLTDYIVSLESYHENVLSVIKKSSKDFDEFSEKFPVKPIKPSLD